jgi:hypothetical protein
MELPQQVRSQVQLGNEGSGYKGKLRGNTGLLLFGLFHFSDKKSCLMFQLRK